jgi:hypothetical protein
MRTEWHWCKNFRRPELAEPVMSARGEQCRRFVLTFRVDNELVVAEVCSLEVSFGIFGNSHDVGPRLALCVLHELSPGGVKGYGTAPDSFRDLILESRLGFLYLPPHFGIAADISRRVRPETEPRHDPVLVLVPATAQGPKRPFIIAKILPGSIVECEGEFDVRKVAGISGNRTVHLTE